MAARVHLVRHGEVSDPDHMVYASLPGYGLSELGISQARSAARYLGRQPVVAVWSSPLERALRTAEPIGGRLGLPVRVDPALGEWGLMDHWAGTSWDVLDSVYPGELARFLERPNDLPFSPESLADLSERVIATIRRLEGDHPHGEIAVVSHSGPLRAATLGLTGEPLTAFWEVQPEHGSVTTLRPGVTWSLESMWAPDPDLFG